MTDYEEATYYYDNPEIDEALAEAAEDHEQERADLANDDRAVGL